MAANPSARSARAVPSTHPRFVSLMTRERIVAGVEAGVTSIHGLIAQGRGEAFDYLLGETTHRFALSAIEASAAVLLAAQHPVISVNGNVAALAAHELVRLATLVGAALEVNIFHSSKARERAIRRALEQAGAARVLMPSRSSVLPGLDHNRRFVHPQGIARADVVFVPLEDGDRCQALRAAGKDVITVDLNPLSRTARTATITIVDNLVRCLPILCDQVVAQQKAGPTAWARARRRYDHARVLRAAERVIRLGGNRPFKTVAATAIADGGDRREQDEGGEDDEHPLGGGAAGVGEIREHGGRGEKMKMGRKRELFTKAS